MSMNSSIKNSLVALSNDFNRLLDNNRLFTDAVLLCDGVEIPVHKCILSARSSVFAAMFQSQMQEGLSGVVNIVDIKLNVLEAMLRHIYTGNIGCPFGDFADELYVAADLYGLDSLKQICTDELKSILSGNNMFDILRFGDLHNETLKMHAIEFICIHELSAMEETEEWKSLEEEYPRLTIEVMKSMVKRSKVSSHKRKRDEHEIVIQCDKGFIALDVNATDTVRDMKEKIQDIHGIPFDEQTLYGTTLLQDSKTLADCEIQEHSSLSLVHIFEICVMTLTGKKIPLEVKKSYTIEEVQKMVEEKEGFPVYQQRLTFKQQQLENSKSLSFYKVTHGSTLLLKLLLRG